MGSFNFKLVLLVAALFIVEAATAPLEGMVVGSVSEPLTAADGSEYLIFLPSTWTTTSIHPILVFLHGVGGISNAKGCRNPGLTTQFPLIDPEYAAKVEHIVIVPVAQRPNWRHHFNSTMDLLDMALSDLGGDPDRVSIAGQSMGGHGAYLYASQLAPGRFCAIVAICSYLDEDNAMTSVVSETVGSVDGTQSYSGKAFTDTILPLKSTPIWLFQSEEDDIVPPPGRPQDDSRKIAKALEFAGNDKVKYTRYVKGDKPPNYIPGHAAFEFAFHEEDIWHWLSMQKRPAKTISRKFAVAAAVIVLILFVVAIRFAGRRWARLPLIISTLALFASSVAHLGLMQSEGGLIDSCYSFTFVGVSTEKCREIGAALTQMGEAERGWLLMVISKARAENCFALGMGAGAVYSLLFLAKGTKEVVVVHLMHACWAVSVFVANAQNAGVLSYFGLLPETNIDANNAAKLVPFTVIVGFQAFLATCAFILSLGRSSNLVKQKTA
jgi:pimeloyl-ACP methyl ester carboxylesterase